MAVVPVQSWDGRAPFSGAVGFRVDRTSLAELGRVSHDDRPADQSPFGGTSPITRSVVVGDSLLTLSHSGVLASDLSDLSPLERVLF